MRQNKGFEDMTMMGTAGKSADLEFPEQIEAVLLAGGIIKHLPSSEPTQAGKGHYPVGDLPMAARTLRALVASPRISRVTLVTPVPRAELGPEWSAAANVVPAGKKLLDSTISGFSAVEHPSHPVLTVAGDLPFLSAEGVTDYVDRCRATSEASLWYGFLRQENSERVFPGVRHTWVRMREGRFCGTGLCCMRPGVLSLMKDALGLITAGRKNPFVLAKVLGWKTLLYLAVQRLTVPMAEEAAQRLLKTSCRGIESPYAGTAYNVDDAESLLEARSLVAHIDAGVPMC